MSTTIGHSSASAANNTVTMMEEVGNTVAEMDTAQVFLKLVKKAEEAAQAAT